MKDQEIESLRKIQLDLKVELAKTEQICDIIRLRLANIDSIFDNHNQINNLQSRIEQLKEAING